MKSTIYFLSYKIAFFLLLNFCYAQAQEKLAPDVYLIRLTDKNQNAYDLSHPEQFLSQRALQRRQRQSIELHINDLPVSQVYIDSLKKMGFEILNRSKWFNAVSVRTTNLLLLDKLLGVSFVKHIQQNKILKSAQVIRNKFELQTTPVLFDSSHFYGPSFSQIAIHKGNFLQSKGFRGQGLLIAVLDAGFYNARNMTGFDSLWMANRVILTRDFVKAGGDVFVADQHGSEVLSVIAATEPGWLEGTAPKASFLLLRSEDATSEYPIEEFNWVAAAELADSLGVDIINTSLGYTTFDDPSLSHTYADMNGHTAISSIAAGITASKGIIVVVSAGNEGNQPWKQISAPADADSVLTAGAIDINGFPAAFSSRGPTYDRRIKPDVVAVGNGTVVQLVNNAFARLNGTSFSAPIITGLTACLWQACPDKSNMEIIRAIQQYSSQYATPDSILGYGIPDFKYALYALNPLQQPGPGYINMYPNPFTSQFTMEFDAIPEGVVKVCIFDVSGRKLFEKQESVNKTFLNKIAINQLSSLSRGVYIVKIFSGSKTLEGKVLKL